VTTTVTATPTPSTTPSPTSTLVASPTGSCASPRNAGALNAGGFLSESGITVGGSVAWYVFSTSLTSWTVTVSGSGSPAASNDVLSVYVGCAIQSPLANGVTSFTGTAAGTYSIAVGTPGGTGPDGGFTLTLSG
jgi:hypothetical protein